MHESPGTSERFAGSVDRKLDTLEQATAYLEGLINRELSAEYTYARLDLEPIRALLEGLGRPDQALSVIHVAGSKGKGSTCLFAESILLELGEHVGTFTSPHLESWVERFRIDGEPVDASRLVAAVDRVRPIVETLLAGPPETLPSFFDATTAVAFLLFAEAGVDRALIEVGLGGRLDSTNIVSPRVTCITSIELEHTDKLGETEEEIAGEKAGILKSGVPVVLGALRSAAAGVIRARADEVGAPARVYGEDFVAFGVAQNGGAIEQPAVELLVPGRVARLNAALAIECVQALGEYDRERVDAAAVRGLKRCRLPARIEILAEDPAVIVDAAHTAESALALAEALVDLAPNGFDLLLSVSSDKKLDALLEPLLRGAGRVWTTRAEPMRSLDADALATLVRKKGVSMGLSLEVESEPDPERATLRARQALASDRHLCAAGSVYLAGIVRRVLRESLAV
jgi:dihydrofolate synthase/folylpolyglutamate synthase